MKQYYEKTLIHFDIDIVLMFLNSLTEDQRRQFIEQRLSILKIKSEALKNKIEREKGGDDEKSYLPIFSYLEHHLKAEMSWLKSLSW